ncbi:MAG: hypothetical protein ACKESB_03830 [Candidatus Hodgkinia cicadicola]
MGRDISGVYNTQKAWNWGVGGFADAVSFPHPPHLTDIWVFWYYKAAGGKTRLSMWEYKLMGESGRPKVSSRDSFKADGESELGVL